MYPTLVEELLELMVTGGGRVRIFMSVASLRFPMVQWRAPHPCTDRQHYLILLGYLGKEDMESWTECSRESGSS